MTDYQGLCEEDLIIVESLMALSHGGVGINHHHPHHQQSLNPNSLVLVDGGGGGGGGGGDSTPTMKMKMTMTKVAPVIRRQRRSRQITLQGIREAHKDIIKEKACRDKIGLLLHHLPEFIPQSQLLSLGIRNKNNHNKMKKKAVKNNATKHFGGPHQPKPKFVMHEVAPLKLKIRKVQDQSCALASSARKTTPFEFDLNLPPSVGF